MRRFVVIIVLFFSMFRLSGQYLEYPFSSGVYPFVGYQKDSISFYGADTVFTPIFRKMDSIILFGQGKLNIVHLGGSHIQADIYTHRVRQGLQELCLDCNGGRGLLTPYRVARTNNPGNYNITSLGIWEYASIVKSKRGFNYGISALTLYKKSQKASLHIEVNKKDSSLYKFSGIQIYHSNVPGLKISSTDTSATSHIFYDSINGYSQLNLVSDLEEITLEFSTPDSISDSLFVYGLYLENENPGFVYNCIGINGASLRSFEKAGLMSAQLRSIKPDVVIISIGTNDANTRYFNTEDYLNRYKNLVDAILLENPEVRFIFTVPNDSKMFSRYVNNNTQVMAGLLKQLAIEYGAGVWDFYTIMGGLSSIENWYSYGLASRDYIHFNKKGYDFKGDLFLNAFLRAYNDHIDYIENENLPGRE